MIVFSNYGFAYPDSGDELAKAIETTGSMLIISLAGTAADAEAEKKGAVRHGFNEDDIVIFTPDKAEEIKHKVFNNIILTGGNTFKLLSEVRRYSLDEYIRSQFNKSTYIGVSAGAYLACTSIEYVKLFEDNNHITDEDYSALGLTQKHVLCHSDTRSLADMLNIRRIIGFDGKELICVSGNEAVIIK